MFTIPKSPIALLLAEATGKVKRFDQWVPHAQPSIFLGKNSREGFLQCTVTTEKWILYDNCKHLAQRLD